MNVNLDINLWTLDRLARLAECVHQISVLRDQQQIRGFNRVRFDAIKEKEEIMEELACSVHDEATTIRHTLLKFHSEPQTQLDPVSI